MDGHFSHIFVVKLFEQMKIHEKEARYGPIKKGFRLKIHLHRQRKKSFPNFSTFSFHRKWSERSGAGRGRANTCPRGSGISARIRNSDSGACWTRTRWRSRLEWKTRRKRDLKIVDKISHKLLQWNLSNSCLLWLPWVKHISGDWRKLFLRLANI